VFEQVVIWASHRACSIVSAIDFARGISATPSVCFYSGSYAGDIIFWALLGLIVFLLILIRPGKRK